MISEDPRNQLAHYIAKVANELKPTFVFYENVIGALSTRIRHPETGHVGTVVDLLASDLPDYRAYIQVTQMADYGIPQQRKRLLVVFVRSDSWEGQRLEQENVTPFPRQTHSEHGTSGTRSWVSLTDFLSGRFSPLDASSPEAAFDENDHLHCVPVYDTQRYELVKAIPPYSGASAFETDTCPNCDAEGIPKHLAICPVCDLPLHTRPIVANARPPRLIVGRRTSYRRMQPDRPATTITTSSGRIGSDNKIHPWENRVMSPRECAALQTVPLSFKWGSAEGRVGLSTIRECVGEAIPVWFTLLLALNLAKLIERQAVGTTFTRCPSRQPSDSVSNKSLNTTSLRSTRKINRSSPTNPLTL